jgi:CRISPR-associated protein Csd2
VSGPIKNRYDFVYFFEVKDGNPNGDPDAGNTPRIDVETGQGLVTDVCLKRKVRNYVSLAFNEKVGYRIFVKEKAVLNAQIEEAYSKSDAVKAALKEWSDWQGDKKRPKPKMAYEDVATQWMCETFFDIRTFGAVLTTGSEKEVEGIKSKIAMTAGQVRGPVQFTMARSIDRIFSAEFAITRCAVTNEKDEQKERTIGRKYAVPYALYRCHGYISPLLADPARKGTGFSEDDLSLLKKCLGFMFETDRSAARGLMSPVSCVAFKHAEPLGNARANQLFERVTAHFKADVPAEERIPRSKNDYVISVDDKNLPKGITIEQDWI